MTGNRHYVLDSFLETPWAILPSKLAALQEIVSRHVAGEKLTAEEIETRIHGAARPPERRVNKVAVLPLFGAIFPRANLMTDMSGATSAEKFSMQFDELLKNPEIDAIILDVNSPGGQSGGIAEVAEKIYQARGQKRIVAVANHMMASAAYWIGTAADELVASPSSDVGSIGVWSAHADYSKAYEDAGIKVSLISAGKYKTAGNPYEPLSDEARAVIQAGVDDCYDLFVRAVAKHRGVKEAAVRNGFGEGRVVGAEEAVKLGMADQVGTLEETINRLFNGNVPLASSNASDTGASTAVQENAAPPLSASDESGQEPAFDSGHTQEARARLASVGNRSLEGETKMLRDLLNQRATLVARATALVDAADKDNRDLTAEERKEFSEIMGAGEDLGQVGALDAQIEQIQSERSKLKTAAEKKFGVVSETEKPGTAGAVVMKRAEFDKLSSGAQAAFVRGGGKLED